MNAKLFKAVKEKYPKYIALFRIGDFYEAYDHDAVLLNENLGLPIVQDEAISRTAFPFMSLDTMLPKIVRAGYGVALVDEIEDKPQTHFNLSTATSHE